MFLTSKPALQIQVLAIEFNALVQSQRTKKFRELARSNFNEFRELDSAIMDRRYDLADAIAALVRLAGGVLTIHPMGTIEFEPAK